MVKASAIVAAFLIACAVPRVVTVVSPYTAVIPLDSASEANEAIVGATRCDLQGHSYIQISRNVTEGQARWIAVHEQLHVRQIEGFGSCRSFVGRYDVDSAFRLSIEIEAYCAVYTAQRALHVSPDPDYEGIIWRLHHRLRSNWDREAVLRAMIC